MAINITISNKAVYVFLAAVFLLVGLGVVYAYNTDYHNAGGNVPIAVGNENVPASQYYASHPTPSVYGHTADEVEWLHPVILDIAKKAAEDKNLVVGGGRIIVATQGEGSYLANWESGAYCESWGKARCDDTGSGLQRSTFNCNEGNKAVMSSSFINGGFGTDSTNQYSNFYIGYLCVKSSVNGVSVSAFSKSMARPPIR